ncbi:MAG: extracellular solute-binding protein, partial [Eubacteriales bacterium]|nr:extracellular solute-binding protein [Eubacteriales bacterium]
MKKLVALLLVLVLACSFCFAAVAEEEAPIERNVVGDGKTVVKIAFDGESFSREALIKVFQQFYDKTGISVEYMFVPFTGGWPGFYSKIETMIAGGDTPDLIRVAVEGFELFRTNGLIASYAPYIEKYPEW